MDALQQIQQRYARYQGDIKEARSKNSPFAGYMGIGSGLDKHPCNKEFYEDVGKLTKEFAASAPDEKEALAVVKWMLEAPVGNKGTDCYWYMLAAQGHCKALIPLLAPADCAALWNWFDRQFPRKARLPVQDQLFKLLAKQTEKK